MSELNHAEKELRISRFYVSEMSTVHSGHCSASWWIDFAYSIVKVQLLKKRFSGQIIVNLSQFRVPCYQFDVKL